MTMAISSESHHYYVVFLVTQIFEVSAVTGHVLLVFFVADHRLRVADHIVVDVEMVSHEVDREQNAEQ